MQKTNTSIKLCSIMDIMGCVVRCRASLPRCLAPHAPNPSVTLAPHLQVGRTSTAQFGQQKSTTEIHMIHFCKGLCQNVSNRQATNAHRSCERYAIHWRSSRTRMFLLFFVTLDCLCSEEPWRDKHVYRTRIRPDHYLKTSVFRISCGSLVVL